MRVLLLLVAVAFAWAEAGDDATYCVDECVKKYETEDTNSTTEKAQCLEGCQFRTAPSGDSMGFEVFKKCHLRCKEEKNDNSPCHYACALPYTSMVVMKYEYDSRNGDAPRVSVVSSQGGSAALSKLSQILGLKAKDIKDEEEDWFDDEEGDDEDVEEGLKKSKAEDLFDGQDEMMRMHQKFERLFADFRRRFFNDDELLKNFAEERPHDHDAFANHGPSVGNVDDDGHEIIFASPRDFNDDSVEFRKSQAETPSGGRRIVLEWEQRLRRFPALLQWAVCAVLLVAIAATLAVTFLVMRQMKLNRYRVLQAQPPVVLSAEAGPLPTKKVPLVNEWKEAEGTPPPAYDQLSVHSKQNANDDQV